MNLEGWELELELGLKQYHIKSSNLHNKHIKSSLHKMKSVLLHISRYTYTWSKKKKKNVCITSTSVNQCFGIRRKRKPWNCKPFWLISCCKHKVYQAYQIHTAGGTGTNYRYSSTQEVKDAPLHPCLPPRNSYSRYAPREVSLPHITPSHSSSDIRFKHFWIIPQHSCGIMI